MNHILLPYSIQRENHPRFGVHAMELLINQLMKLGGERKRFVAKAFGGANLFGDGVGFPIGTDNRRFVREFLATEKIPLVAERLGGICAVRLYFETLTGKATVHTVDGSKIQKIAQEERSYGDKVGKNASAAGEITLF